MNIIEAIFGGIKRMTEENKTLKAKNEILETAKAEQDAKLKDLAIALGIDLSQVTE